jgi:MinD-like ATPase involved in chromosome partitioning or flagellar assembly
VPPPVSPVPSSASLVEAAEDSGLWLPRATYLSITSGDGVRGKTFLAANLAFGLHQRGRRVAVVGADAEDMSAIEAAAHDVQTVIIDTASSGDLSRAVWGISTLALVVAEPGSEQLKASYVAVKRVHAAGCPRIGLVINLVRSYAQGEACFRKLAEISRKFLKINLRNYGYIFYDDAVNEALRQAVPLVKAFPDSKAGKCLDSILGLIAMDESAIARRRKEVRLAECALKSGKLEALRS